MIPPPSRPREAPSILLVTTCWWPAFATFADLLRINGARIAALAPQGHPVRALKAVTIHDQDALNPLGALRRAIDRARPGLIIPGDERALFHLHLLHAQAGPALRALIETSLGPAPSYAVTQSRLETLRAARRLGLRTPAFRPIETLAQLRDWMRERPGPWVLKAESSWGGMGVRFITLPGEAPAQLRALSRQSNLPTALRRLLINRDPFWLSDILMRRPSGLLAQAHIEGDPGDLAMFCLDGVIQAATMARALTRTSQSGPSTHVRIITRPDFLEAATKLAAALRLTGYYGLDFIIERATGQAHFIELNPRPTALTNIKTAAHDLIATALARLGDLAPHPRPAAALGDIVAHYPRPDADIEQRTGLRPKLYNLPAEPALIGELLKDRWPDRQLLARLDSGSRRLARRMLRRQP